MRNQYAIKGRYMQKRFKLVCAAMGWDCRGDMFEGEGETRRSRAGHTWIQRAGTQKPYYRIAQMTGHNYGERNLSDNYTPI